MGRPTKLTEGLTEQLAAIFREGQTSIESACALVGISRSTYHKWMNEYSDFSDTIQKARAEAVQGYLQVIKDAASDGTWQAAAWWLERVLPTQYGRKTTIETISTDALVARLEELERDLAINDPVAD
jgi:transposase-like protein